MAKKKKSRKRKITKNQNSSLNTLLILGMMLFVAYFFYSKFISKPSVKLSPTRSIYANEKEMLDGINRHYGKQIETLSKKFNLSSAYLKALIALECSGNPNPPSRFEKGVYDKLKAVRNRESNHYGSIRYKTVKDASDDALKNLASSWGPFQLMGYQCIEMNIYVNDIRGKNSLFYGVKWINQRYGKYVRKGKYKDAFHIHNTGQPLPKSGKAFTYDPNYIPNGLNYMFYFQKTEKDQSLNPSSN